MYGAKMNIKMDKEPEPFKVNSLSDQLSFFSISQSSLIKRKMSSSSYSCRLEVESEVKELVHYDPHNKRESIQAEKEESEEKQLK